MDAKTLARFLVKFTVNAETGCWEWIAKPNPNGYAHFYYRKSRRAHRVSYEHFVGVIPDGLVLDHLCRNRICVRPDHLEAVTHRENDLRGHSPNMLTMKRGVCQRGHEMRGENAYVRNGRCGNVSVACKACIRLASAAYRVKHKRVMAEKRKLYEQRKRATVSAYQSTVDRPQAATSAP